MEEKHEIVSSTPTLREARLPVTRLFCHRACITTKTPAHGHIRRQRSGTWAVPDSLNVFVITLTTLNSNSNRYSPRLLRALWSHRDPPRSSPRIFPTVPETLPWFLTPAICCTKRYLLIFSRRLQHLRLGWRGVETEQNRSSQEY